MTRDSHFSDYVSAHWLRLVRSAVLLGCDLPDAEDVVQTALLRCYVHWPKVVKASDMDAYVFRVLINALNDKGRAPWRRERPMIDPARGLEAVGNAIEEVGELDIVMRALARLSKANREVVVLRYYCHMSESQIAACLGIARGTVKSRMSRALQSLSVDSELSELAGKAAP